MSKFNSYNLIKITEDIILNINCNPNLEKATKALGLLVEISKKFNLPLPLPSLEKERPPLFEKKVLSNFYTKEFYGQAYHIRVARDTLVKNIINSFEKKLTKAKINGCSLLLKGSTGINKFLGKQTINSSDIDMELFVKREDFYNVIEIFKNLEIKESLLGKRFQQFCETKELQIVENPTNIIRYFNGSDKYLDMGCDYCSEFKEFPNRTKYIRTSLQGVVGKGLYRVGFQAVHNGKKIFIEILDILISVKDFENNLPTIDKSDFFKW